jgi:hypothetical protein
MTTFNYSAIAYFHTLQVTTAPAKSFPAGSVFTSSCLVTAPTTAAFVLKSALNGGSLPTAHSCSSCPPYSRSVRKHALLPREYDCLRSLITEPFVSNGCFSGSTFLVLSKYATIESSDIARHCASIILAGLERAKKHMRIAGFRTTNCIRDLPGTKLGYKLLDREFRLV